MKEQTHFWTRHSIYNVFLCITKKTRNCFFFNPNLDANKNSLRFLTQANNKSEGVCKAYILLILGGFVVNTVIMSAISVAMCLYTNGYFDVQYLYHPFSFS